MKAAWESVRARVAAACAKAGRGLESVKILPVSKGQSPELIRKTLAQPGFPQRLGENYLAELEEKQDALKANVEWHFLGPLQSRKIPEIGARVHYLHAVARAKEVQALAALPQAPKFFVQVNVSGELQKNGCNEADLPALLEAAAHTGLEGNIAGLMCLPAPIEEIGEAALRAQFARLRELRDRYVPSGELSMGMSSDFEIAIAEGSGWIRLGTVLFGKR